MVENGDEANKVVLVLSFILGECDKPTHEHCGKANNRRRGTRPTTTT
jgi:hypothetical protein